MAAVAVVIARQPRRRPRLAVGVVEVAVLADVVQLVDDRGALGVDRVGDPPERLDDRIVTVSEVASRQYAGRMDRYGLDHDHRGSAAGPFEVVAEVAVAG